MPYHKLTRRAFIQKSGAVAASTGAIWTGWNRLAVAATPEYQYIVVGSGAGGGPVAARLAQEGLKVLLIEAGDHSENLNYSVPAFHPLASEDELYSWNFWVKHYSDPAKARQDSKYRPKGILYPRAGTLGGCTAHNAMITMYPDDSDWDHISEMFAGDPEASKRWHSDSMREYFIKTERASYLSPTLAKARGHGSEGWLNTDQTSPSLLMQDPKFLLLWLAAARTVVQNHGKRKTLINLQQKLVSRIIAAAGRLEFSDLGRMIDEEIDLKELFSLDPNDLTHVAQRVSGVFNPPKATFGGKRNGTRELLLDAKVRYGLTISEHSLATRILFHEELSQKGNLRIAGIEYLSDAKSVYEADPRSTLERRRKGGTKKTALLEKGGELIISGGAFNSPQLLLLSGIGDEAKLRPHGIGQRLNLKGVGENLQDRYEVGVVTRWKHPFKSLEGCTFGGAKGALPDPGLGGYHKDPRGHLYGTNGVVVGVKTKSGHSKSSDGSDLNDLWVFAVPGYFKGYEPGYSKASLQSDHFTWAILKGHTQNTKGTIALRSTYATDLPEINFKYYNDGIDHEGDDLDAVVKGIQLAREMNENLTLTPVGRHFIVKEEVLPGKGVRGDADLREFVKREAWGHHASCSNKMGPATDPMAVVDSQFRVHGTANLRIVDASVFPKIPGLFIVCPTYMIAEKAADDILRDRRV